MNTQEQPAPPVCVQAAIGLALTTSAYVLTVALFSLGRIA